MEQTQAYHFIDEPVKQDVFYQYLTGGMCKLLQSKPIFLNKLENGQDAVSLLKETYFQCGLLGKDAGHEELKQLLLAFASNGLVFHIEDKVAADILTTKEHWEHFVAPSRKGSLHIAAGWQKEEKRMGAQWEEALLMANIMAKVLTDSSVIGTNQHATLSDQVLTYHYNNIMNIANLEDKQGAFKEALAYFKEYAVRNRTFGPAKEYKAITQGITTLRKGADEHSLEVQASMLLRWMEQFYAALVKQFVDTRTVVRKVRADLGEFKHPLVSKENELFGDGKFLLYTRTHLKNEVELLKKRIAGCFYMPGALTAVNMFAGRNLQYLSGLHSSTGMGTIGTANLTANWFDKSAPEWGQWVRSIMVMLEVSARRQYCPSIKALFDSSYVIPDIIKIAKTKRFTAYAMGNLDKSTYSAVLTDKNGRQALVLVNRDKLENLNNITSLEIKDDRIEATSKAGVTDSLWFHVMGTKLNEPEKQLCMN